MTVSVAIATTIALGDDVTTAFEFDFVAATAADISVKVTDADGVTVTIDPVLYTVALNAAATGDLWGTGGTVTYPIAGSGADPLPTGSVITMARTVPYTQTVSIINQGAFYPRAVEQALDLLEMQIQQLYGVQSSGTSSSGGNVIGPTTGSNYGVAYFIGGNGQRIASTAAGTAGYILYGSGAAPPGFALPPGQANGLIQVDVYTTGSHTLAAPTYATYAMVTMIGGGGGGQGVPGSPGAGNVDVGTGGSGAGWLQALISASTINGESLVVGAKGAGGAAGANDGGDGGDTTLLTYTAFGGLGGTSGSTASSPPVTAHVMAGGSTSGSTLAAARPGGPSGAELTTSTSAAFGGHGGDSELAPITGPATCGADSQTSGSNATGFGGGGGGAVASGAGVSASGGNGSDGSATIAWYGPVPADTGISAATQAQEESGTASLVYVAPSVQQFHDGDAKAVAVVASDGTLEFGYNIDSVTSAGSGQYSVTFTNAFATTSFGCIVTAENNAPGEPSYYNKTTTSVDLNIALGHSPNETDAPFSLTCYGRLA